MTLGKTGLLAALLAAATFTLACKSEGLRHNDSPIVPSTFRDRQVTVQGEVRIPTREVVFEISDDEIVDGDIVSLYVNGNAVLSRHPLGAQPTRVGATLDYTGYNWVLLHAIDEGDLPPDTAALTLVSGGQRTDVVINATREASGAWNIFVEGTE